MDKINQSQLAKSIQIALKRTERGIYLRSYHKRVAANAIKIYNERINGEYNG